MTTIQERLLGAAGAKTRAAYRKLYGPDPVRAEPSPAPVRPPRPDPLPLDPLEAVSFGSSAARDLAEEAGLHWADFAFDPKGASGESGWLVSDVKRVIALRDEENGEED